jgi:hypothetical protein
LGRDHSRQCCPQSGLRAAEPHPHRSRRNTKHPSNVDGREFLDDAEREDLLVACAEPVECISHACVLCGSRDRFEYGISMVGNRLDAHLPQQCLVAGLGSLAVACHVRGRDQQPTDERVVHQANAPAPAPRLEEHDRRDILGIALVIHEAPSLPMHTRDVKVEDSRERCVVASEHPLP